MTSVGDFIEEYKELKAQPNIEVDYVFMTHDFAERVAGVLHRSFTIPKQVGESFEKGGNIVILRGCLDEDVEVYTLFRHHEHSDGRKEYMIEVNELCGICPRCSNTELYDQKREEYYCPGCSKYDLMKYKALSGLKRIGNYLTELAQ